ncbi:uncharacterized protein K460DRAFT_378059 [Cucurbitaria berberidis CBS 394.84]|uniref:Uncharacterized protein n=1 Tax=Cucurbitaria berberidis CBS 394.84 TaxID=1168544 RepID=A0A9P4GBF3_9PLEO|nr:uncharacterized protein K460DRAFT_378059 [Cucurbitaria berberidis CBS 394.84]KAF1842748.1 hypothetical protein K460DRAFT_378059 [Cucurbitaria berberidis CBS 394.84]
MPKGGTGTKHHCAGGRAWIGDISPGGCIEVKSGPLIYCKKHEMPCRNGCRCQSCERKRDAEAKRERLVAAAERDSEKSKENETFWNPGKIRKQSKY